MIQIKIQRRKIELVLVTAFCLIVGSLANAAHAPESEREAIRSFAGCNEVTFDFAETFPLQDSYKIHDRYFSSGREWITVDEDDGDRISLQHVLLIPGGGGAQKHWRQEWFYERGSILQYRGNMIWEKTALSSQQSAGRWVQRVTQVDDSPRYECAAPWVQWGSTKYWECEAWAPVPRRDLKRGDYNVLARRNRQMLIADGWMHEEDNTKLQVAGSAAPVALVKEKGENHYRRIDDSKCNGARDWWQDNRETWHGIVDAWNELYERETKIAFKTTEGQPPLFEKLFDLAERATQAGISRAEVAREAAAIIASYRAASVSGL